MALFHPASRESLEKGSVAGGGGEGGVVPFDRFRGFRLAVRGLVVLNDYLSILVVSKQYCSAGAASFDSDTACW